MERTLSLGAFTELSKNEAMKTEGGWDPITITIVAAVGVYTLANVICSYALAEQEKNIAKEQLAFEKHCENVMYNNIIMGK